MSGHSKWATIKHQKSTNDQARGKLFSKLSRAITLAVRDGGGGIDPKKNYKLQVAIDKAKEQNMPKDNVKRAIDKAMGKGRGSLESMQFGGYGPAGIGVIVETITDNKQRTLQELKSFFKSKGGSEAAPGAVLYNFFPQGQILVAMDKAVEEQILRIMDIPGVEDVDRKQGLIEVMTSKSDLARIIEEIKNQAWQIKSTSLVMTPKTKIVINEKKKVEKIVDFIEELKDLDDVQKVFTNFNIP